MQSTTRSSGKRVIIYGRLSNASERSISIERQLAACRGYAAQFGHTVVAEIFDDGVSGSKVPDIRDRPTWPQIQAVPAWDAILVYMMDRVGRVMVDALILQRDLDKQGKALISAAPGQQFDWSTTDGRFGAQLSLAMAEAEASRIRDRVLDAQTKLLHAGYVGMQQTALHLSTYREGGNGKKIATVDEERGPIIRRAISRYIGGANLLEVGRWLMDQGVTPARSDHFTHTSLRDYFQSPTLYGAVIENGQPIRNADGTVYTDERRALLTRAEWDELQDAIEGRRGTKRAANSAPVLLRDCIRCEGCKRPLLRSGKRMTCTRANCTQRSSTMAAPLEAYIVAEFLKIRGDHEVVARGQVDADPEGVANLKEAVTAAEQRANAAMRAGDMDAMLQAAQQRTYLQAELDQLERPEARVYTLRGTGKTYAEVWAEAGHDTEAQNKLLQAWLPIIVLHGTHAGKTLAERCEWDWQ